MTESEKLKMCAGCRNNFYNHRDGAGKCWSLKDAKKVKRWRIWWWTPMDKRENFKRVTVLDCYHEQGPNKYGYMERLPDHLGGDRA